MGDNTPSNQIAPKPAMVFRRPIDWAIGPIRSIAGALIAHGGIALYFGVTCPEIADYVHSSEFQSEVLTDVETINV